MQTKNTPKTDKLMALCRKHNCTPSTMAGRIIGCTWPHNFKLTAAEKAGLRRFSATLRNGRFYDLMFRLWSGGTVAVSKLP